MTVPTPVRFTAADDVELEGEWTEPPGANVAAVLCHAHPLYGGSMRDMVTSAQFEALPRAGIACLRFNFRGVDGSSGEHGEGRTEPQDVRAALDAAAERTALPLVLVGWSFGADMALGVTDDRVRAWVGVAPPLRFRSTADYATVGADARPKLLILAAHDEFRAAEEVKAEVAHWNATRVEIVPGASHFFVGRSAAVTELTAEFVRNLAG